MQSEWRSLTVRFPHQQRLVLLVGRLLRLWRVVVVRTTLPVLLEVLRTQIPLGTAKAGMVVETVTMLQTKGPTGTHADSGYRQGVRPVVVILLREVAEVVPAAAVGVAVTTAPHTPPTPEPPEVCHPPGVIFNRSFKCCRP